MANSQYDPYEEKQKKRFSLIRKPPCSQNNQWIDYLQKRGIQIDKINELLILTFNCYRHLLFTDFLELFKAKKIQYQWKNEFDEEFQTLLTSLLEELTTLQFDCTWLNLEDLVFDLSKSEIKLFTLYGQTKGQIQVKNLIDQQQELSPLLKTQGSNKWQATSLFQIIKEAINSVTKIIINDYPLALKSALIQRLQLKVQYNISSSDRYQVQNTIEDIFKLTSNLSGNVQAQYITTRLVEQNLDTLKRELNFLQKLNKKTPITNQCKIELLYKNDSQSLLNEVTEDMWQQFQIANQVLTTGLNDLDENITESHIQGIVEKTHLKNKLEHSIITYAKNNNQQNILLAFSQELRDKIILDYWVFDGVSQFGSGTATEIAILKFLKSYEETFLENEEERGLILSQLSNSLIEKDEYQILDNLFDEKLLLITNNFENNLSQNFEDQENIKKQVTNFSQSISRAKQQLITQMKSQFLRQNDILYEVLNKAKEPFKKMITNTGIVEDKIEAAWYDFLQLQFEPQIKSQQNLLLKDFLENLQNFNTPSDCMFLRECIKQEDFKQFINPFVRNETIMKSTLYKKFIDRMKNCWMQYLQFRGQLNHLTSFLDENQMVFKFPLNKFRQEILKSSFKDYLFKNDNSAFQIEFRDTQILEQFKTSVQLQLKNQLLMKTKTKKYENYFIPFEVIEPLVSQEQQQLEEIFQSYEQVCEVLEEQENNDINNIQGLQQPRISQWKNSADRQGIFDNLKQHRPTDWNAQLLLDQFSEKRFLFFLPERKKKRLQNAVDQIFKLFNEQCNEFLNETPVLKEFNLDQIDLDWAIKEDQKTFTINSEFLEQVYKFFEKQIEDHLTKLIE